MHFPFFKSFKRVVWLVSLLWKRSSILFYISCTKCKIQLLAKTSESLFADVWVESRVLTLRCSAMSLKSRLRSFLFLCLIPARFVSQIANKRNSKSAMWACFLQIVLLFLSSLSGNWTTINPYYVQYCTIIYRTKKERERNCERRKRGEKEIGIELKNVV